MDRVEVSTVVYVPPAEAYDFLVDFPGYADYSNHLESVERHGDGGPGTRYDINLQWWKLTYTVRSEVTDLDPPECIDWHIVKDLDAHGEWLVEPISTAAHPDGGADTADGGADTSDGGTDPSDGGTDPSDGGAETKPEDADEASLDDATASRIRLVIEFDSSSASADMLDLPRLVSLDWVVNKVKPLVLGEAERVVERIVADLEGEHRDVELTLHTTPDTV